MAHFSIYIGVVVILQLWLGLKTFDPPLISLLDETLKRGSMTIFKDNLLTRRCSDETGDCVLPGFIPRDLVFKPDLSHHYFCMQINHGKNTWTVRI